MKKILGVLLVVLVALSSWSLPLWFAPAASPAPVPALSLPGHFVSEGTPIQPTSPTQGLHTERAGRVWEVYFSAGQRVHKGQVLVKVAHSIQTVEQQQLQAQIVQQQAQYQALATEPATTSTALAAARVKLVELQEKLAHTSRALAFVFVTAPEEGFITTRSVTPGEYINTAQTLASFVPGMSADTTLLLSSVE